ncbi:MULTISPECIES: DUF4335 domain-containing protein [unclassified Okeania]|uniref:DUF4335 domain-containing protein n=1 Tax=unclassified Okeania TaxID=2634635 RepID=UPI0013B688DF|nr:MULTISPECIES: DUF4335 domain-containing protein [unclassified Okeania]NES79602.1 DUF4335 domain-containing protein [Okeania sp. SIO1H4]NET14998.1 DUF4335 domain-containing protein [Okeania sp. SIO1H6]NET23263.1 DUF4335 domain-containing protein [Okeania sp. SIO1H5]
MPSRSYTPPTCTLKFTARGLAVLKWIGISRKQRFSLSFDDPRVSETEHITLRGGRSELDALHKVVTTYVQEFLSKSPELPLDNENNKGEENNSTATESNSQTKIQEEITEVADAKLSIPNSPPPINGQTIYLQPRDLLNHDLFLGSLATKESGSFITMSMLQLFDLAIALDECEADIQTLPQFKSDSEVTPLPEWLRSAVLIIISAGLTVSAIKLYDRYAISRKPQNEPNIIASPPSNSSPIPTPPTNLPTPTPTVTLSPLPTPPTNLPTPTITRPSPIPTPSPLFPRQNPASPAPNNLPPPLNDFSRPPQNQGNATTVVIPAQPTILPPVPVAPPTTPPPVPPPAIPNYGVSVQPRPPVQPPPNLQIPPAPNRPLPPALNRGGGVRPYVDVSRIPVNVPRAIDLPTLEDVEPVALRDRESVVEPSENAGRKPKSTLFDRIPQVAEVREYFEKSWEPPSDLDKNLQYSLLLNGDGSVKKVTPIGLASVEFYGNTKMPLEDQVFVSNIEGDKTAKIRLVLRPDGQVQTFLESLN